VTLVQAHGLLRMQISFHRARAELTYIVEASPDLVTWTTLIVNPGTVGAAITVTDPEPVTATTPRFLRLRVQ